MPVEMITSGMKVIPTLNSSLMKVSDVSKTDNENFTNLLEQLKTENNAKIDTNQSDFAVQFNEHNIPLPHSSNNSFGSFVKEIITDVNEAQVDSYDMTDAFIKGEPVELHDVMIAANKAKTSFQLLVELRNKGLDLYREVMRMQ